MLTLFHQNATSFTSAKTTLIPMIEELVKPDIIWLLGASRYSRRAESIFNTDIPTSHHISDYYFLILMPDFCGKAQHEWQDRIEQRCSKVIPVTTIVMETRTFQQWYAEGHPFPHKICEKAIVFYDAGNFNLEPAPYTHCSSKNENEKFFTKGLTKAREFLAGAELFQIRNQNAMASFMLHQSAEQALRALLKIGIHFHINTHNLDRLIRYASLVSTKITDIFSQNTEQDKRLFNLLQKAYSDSRYKKEYHITTNDLMLLIEKVKALHGILEEERNRVKERGNLH